MLHAPPPPAVTIHAAGAALRFHVSSGGRARTLRVFFRPPAWPERRIAGSPIGFRRPRLRGPGRLGFSSAVADYAFGACVRGGLDAQVVGFDLRLRAHVSTTVVERVFATRRRWPGTRYQPRILAAWDRGRVRRLAVPRLHVRVRDGVHIQLSSDPALDQSKFGADGPFLPFGQAVVVRGSTRPALSGATLHLSALREAGPTIALGDVGTDAGGRFAAAAWRPPVGTYLVRARYDGRLADSACDMHFAVR
jgi:hypothetical protein